MSQIYRRLDPNEPSYTVTGSSGVYHWSEPRALTNRERARLQTFPDDFVFYGSKESVRKQIGMAFPCQGAEINNVTDYVFNNVYFETSSMNRRLGVQSKLIFESKGGAEMVRDIFQNGGLLRILFW